VKRRRFKFKVVQFQNRLPFTATMVVPTEMKLEGKAKQLLMPQETLAHRKHGIVFIPVVRVLLL
jgi:hypothetical protein